MLLLACAACTRGPGDELDPVPAGVLPARGANIAPVPVVIQGENFHPLVVQRIGAGPPLELDERFEVYLGDTALVEVRWRDAEHLDAVVPAGLPEGWHDLTVVSPLGRRVRLEHAYFSFTPPLSALAASLSIPAKIDLGASFAVTMTVSNTSTTDAVAVAPSSLSLSGAGAATLVSGPTPASLSIAGGSSASFSWVYSADALGTVTFTGSAAGADGNTGAPISSVPATSNAGTIKELEQVLADPFGDGTSFSFVFPYDGKIYLGPSANGTGGARFNPDGSGAQSFAFSFHEDVTTGETSGNSSPAPYPSIGATGCAADTPACGPDNENGRGLFFSGVIGGQEWLAVGGGRSSGDLSYIYMTRDLGSRLTFSYVDLSGMLGSATRGISSAIVFNDTVYLGFSDTGSNRPYVVALRRLPTPPGMDALSSADAESLEGEKMPGIGAGNSAPMNMIDSMAVFADRLYLANNGGCIRSTTTTPRRYGAAPGDWANCTPNAGAYMARTSITTTRTADVEPADKAVPRMAVFGGRLFLARNTTLGPQLFACDPALIAPVEHCDPEDWYLVAPDSAGSLQTRFDNPANAAVTLLVATSRHLYVGFNNAGGLVLFRTSNPRATTRADFQGHAGCAADLHPASCEGLGHDGLAVGATRLFDGVATTFGTSEAVYLTAGTGSTAVRVFRVSD